MPEIAVLLPCYNEAPTLAKVIEDSKRYLPEAKIYVFDNNSTDGSGDIARKLGCTVIEEKRQGKGYVVRSMLEKVDADCYIMVDADDTYDLSSAPEMCRRVLEDGDDMVVGDRLAGAYYKENKRPFHNTGNKIVSFLVKILFGKGISDVMTGYRAFSPRFAKGFKPRTNGFQIETELSIYALSEGLHISQITIGYKDRPVDSPSKLNTVRDGIKILALIAHSLFMLKTSLACTILAFPLVLAGGVILGFYLAGYHALPFLVSWIVLIALALIILVVGLVVDGVRHRRKK